MTITVTDVRMDAVTGEPGPDGWQHPIPVRASATFKVQTWVPCWLARWYLRRRLAGGGK